MKGRITASRAYKVRQGAVLAQGLTSSWTNGNSVQVEAVTDLSPSGGDGYFKTDPDADTGEYFTYSGIEINGSDNPSTPDLILGVQRLNPVAHAKGTWVQDGDPETVEKQVDGFLDGHPEPVAGVPVDPVAYTLIPLEAFAESDMPVLPIEIDDTGNALVTGGAVGAVPRVGADPETVPPANELPPPNTDRKPEAPTGFSATARNVALPDGTYVYFVDGTFSHSGLYEDGSEATGIHFRADFYDGATLRFTVDIGPSLAFTQQVEGNKIYDVELFALDFANVESDPATDSVTTSPDSSAPATPTGLALLGGAGGGGVGIIYAQWNPNTEPDFDHYEVHASTVSSSFTPSAATLIATTGATNHPISKAYNGTSIVTFGYSTTVHVKLKAVDRSTNASAASSVASSTAAQAASADITDIQSDNYVLGTSGWRFTKAGNLEANNGTFRGSLTAGTIVSLSSSGGGVTITGSTDTIHLGTSGSGLTLSGSGTGSISFGSGCTISGASTGSINVGTGITLSGTDSASGTAGKITVGTGITLDGASTGTITGGTVRTASSGTYVRLGAATAGNDTIEFWNGTTVLGRISSTTTGSGSLHMRGNTSVYIDTPVAAGTDINIGAGNTEDVTINPFGDVRLGEAAAGTDNVIVDAAMRTTSGNRIRIGHDANSSGNYLQLRSTGGSDPAGEASYFTLWFDGTDLKGRKGTGTAFVVERTTTTGRW